MLVLVLLRIHIQQLTSRSNVSRPKPCHSGHHTSGDAMNGPLHSYLHTASISHADILPHLPLSHPNATLPRLNRAPSTESVLVQIVIHMHLLYASAPHRAIRQGLLLLLSRHTVLQRSPLGHKSVSKCIEKVPLWFPVTTQT